MAASGTLPFGGGGGGGGGSPGSGVAEMQQATGVPYRVSLDHLGLDEYSTTLNGGGGAGPFHPHHHPQSHHHHHHHHAQHAQSLHHQAHQHPSLPFGRLASQAQSQPRQFATAGRNGGGGVGTSAVAIDGSGGVGAGTAGGGGQFGILTPTTIPRDVFLGDAPHGSMEIDGHGSGLSSVTAAGGATAGGLVRDGNKQSHSQFHTRIVVDPPDLAVWRDKLFNVDEMIVLTNDEFETYFPHIDNVYSHRSTQRYKRKPFVSHYWDCRMKGRPPGTPKSDDPNKKKRKRNARERDLCDVKIKITEYAPGAQIQLDDGTTSTSSAAYTQQQQQQQQSHQSIDVGPGQKFWTIQRVNGNGGNGKGDGVAGPHRHTLEKSDEIKKNSIQRYVAKQEKENN